MDNSHDDLREVVFIDFETYYDDVLTLKDMSVEAYVSAKRFAVHGMGYWSEKTGPGFAWTAEGARKRLLELGVHKGGTVTVAHNMAFDGFVANRLLPKGSPLSCPVCTIGMARFTVAGRLSRLSLKALAKHFGFPDKGDIGQFKGVRELDFKLRSRLRAEMEAYCLNDVELTRLLYGKLRPNVTHEAMEFIALSLRMYIDPRLRLDLPLLEKYRADLERKQDEGVDRLRETFGVGCREEFLKMIRSRATFAGMLRELGAEVPMKRSAALEAQVAKAAEEAGEIVALAESGAELDRRTIARGERLLKIIQTGSMTPALAKSDLAFQDLMDSEDEDVADLCRLRAENNSSIALSRADAFIGAARRGGVLPVPLSPFRTVTGRYAAGNEGGGRTDGFNLQNLPKRTGDMTLRKAILAPEGHVLVAGDSSQIEARVGAWLAGQADLLDIFRRGDDPYVEMAATIFGGHTYEEILKGAKRDKDPEFVRMRNIGKEVILSSQYGISGDTFGRRLLQQKVRLADDTEEHYAEARRINGLYRNRFRRIRQTWWDLDSCLRRAAVAEGCLFMYPTAEMESKDIDATVQNHVLTVVLPNSFPLVYPEIGIEGRDVTYVQTGGFSSKPVRKHIYGGLLFNNITQGTAFAMLADQAVRLANMGYRIVANVHDSWVLSVPDDEEEIKKAKKELLETLSTPPSWAEGVPLGAEVKSGPTYEVA